MTRKGLVLVLLLAVCTLLITPAFGDDAAATYKSKCASCHGADGKGSAVGQKMGTHDFHSPEVAKMSDTDLFNAIKNGKAKMPKYDGKLTDDQIKALVKYIRSLK